MPDDQPEKQKANMHNEVYSQSGKPYTSQIIINLTHEKRLKIAQDEIQSRWNKRHPESPCQIISGKNFLNATDKGKEPIAAASDDVIRIYILAHCSENSPYLAFFDESKQEYYKIKHGIVAEQLIPIIGNKHAVVNLIACRAGRGNPEISPNEDAGFGSFASELHADLRKFSGRDIPVVARTHTLSPSLKWNLEKKTVDLHISLADANNENLRANQYIHHQPGSKVIYVSGTDGNQMRLDAYYTHWKNKVLRALVLAQSHTKSEEKIKFLDDWQNRFINMTFQDILTIMDDELKKPDTILKKHTSYLSSMFFHPASYMIINNLVIKGKKILDSEYTRMEPVQTGRKIPF